MSVIIKMNPKAVEALQRDAQLFLATIAENIRIEAQDIVPVRTGNLRKSIEVFEGKDENEKLVGTKESEYALYVELGTVKMSPRPFLRPAMDKIVRSLS